MKYLLNPLKLKLVIITSKRKVIKVVFIKKWRTGNIKNKGQTSTKIHFTNQQRKM